MTVLAARREAGRKTAMPLESRMPADLFGRAETRPVPVQGAPNISPLWVGWFTRYSRWYLRRHFHSLRCAADGAASLPDQVPWVIYVNHASWWDPLVGLVLKDALFPVRRLYAPIQQQAVDRYALLKRMGFFGVEQGTSRGAIRFLRACEQILSSSRSVLAITPQGRFADSRERPLRFDPGLGALATRCPATLFVPVAIEYVFWEERLPEILIRLGHPTLVCRGKDEVGEARNGSQWTECFERELGETQDRLATAVQRRNPDEFRTLLRGGAGQGGVYDVWRSLRARLRGDRFYKEHGLK